MTCSQQHSYGPPLPFPALQSESERLSNSLSVSLWISFFHQQNVKWFGSHNRTTQQLWTATLNILDTPRWSQIGWMQSDVFSGAPRLLHQCSWILRMLWNRIQEYPEECIDDFKMLPNQTIRMCKFRSYWEYWPRFRRYSGAPRTWSHTLWEW